jgi:NitT/TauT family transport system substrate-binding protein
MKLPKIWTLLVTGLFVAACGAAPSPAPGATPDPGETPAIATPAASPTPTEEEHVRQFRHALASVPGVSEVGILAAIDALNEQGYNIEWDVMTETELATESVASNTAQFSSGASNSALQAIAAGGDLRIIAERIRNEWTLMAVTGVAACEDLQGQRLAVHSLGAVSTAMVLHWIQTECPGTEPDVLVLPGSPNRYAALVAGQIDASPVELSDAMRLEDEGDRFHMLTSFAEGLPELHPSTMYGNATFMSENPGTVRAYLRAMAEQYRMINADPEYLVELIDRYVEGIPEDEARRIAERYVELGLFDPNLGLDEQGLAATIEIFEDAGAIPPGLTVESTGDLSYLNDVIDEIGRE